MDYSGRTRTLSSLVKDMKNFKFSFDSPLQRKEVKEYTRISKYLILSCITSSSLLNFLFAIKPVEQITKKWADRFHTSLLPSWSNPFY